MKKRAFSLLEISIVLVIIGILIVGISQGVNLVKTSRLSNARLLTAKSNITEIDGLIAWYETSLLESFNIDEARQGNAISSWYDSSPQSNISNPRKNILTKTPDPCLSYVAEGINKIPSLEFDGSCAISLDNFYQGSFSQSTIFIVFRPLNTFNSTAKVIFDSSASNNPVKIGLKNNAINLNAGTSIDTNTSNNPASFNAANDYILNAYFNGSYSKVFLNDVENEIGSSTINPGSNLLDGLTLGADNSSTNNFTGLISEIIIYNRPLKLSQRRNVMRYLAKKYQINVTAL